MVRGLVYCAKDPRFETYFELRVGRSLFPPSSEWGPGGKNGEIKAARKGTGHPTSKSQWSKTSVLSNKHFSNVRIVYGTYFYLTYAINIKGGSRVD